MVQLKPQTAANPNPIQFISERLHTKRETMAMMGQESPAAAPEQAPANLVLIELYVSLTAALLVFLALFGSLRRRCRSPVFKISVWTAYILCTYLVTYSMGLMRSAPFHNRLFAVWGSLLLIVLGSADSVSAFSLEDNEQRKRYSWNYIVQSFWLGWLFGLYSDGRIFQLQIWLLYPVIVLKVAERGAAFMLAGRPALARDTKLIMDFMGYEHEFSNHDEITDPTQMKGYNYLVRGEDEEKCTIIPPLYQKRLEIKDDKVITIQKIWQCTGPLFHSENDQLKDICLSFALYKLICRRFAAYPLWECRHEKTWSFVRYGLLSKEDDYERAFRVIELELSFLFDLFYTKYPVIFLQREMLIIKIIELICMVISGWIAASILHDYQTPAGEVSHNFDNKKIDVLVTGIVICAIVFLEVVQLFFIIFSDWAKVILLCKYVQKPSWQASKCVEKMIKFVCSVRLVKPWERKIGQYSLLKSFNHKPSRMMYNVFTSQFLDRPGNGRKESNQRKLPVEVKKAIILSLKTNGQRLSNGVESLRQNGVENELSWACRLETCTHVIMVWHIATSLCEVALARSNSGSESEHSIVATSLSKYCAYLVAFAPKFLPDNAYVSESIFDQIVIEASDFLKKPKPMEKTFEKMMTLGDGERGDTVIKRGAVLGKHLLHSLENEDLRWKILADFWAEMMLFVAPSDDATIHAEYLAQGGEFVTHLWALLSHAGILKRDSIGPEI